jgi:hypothetical protein
MLPVGVCTKAQTDKYRTLCHSFEPLIPYRIATHSRANHTTTLSVIKNKVDTNHTAPAVINDKTDANHTTLAVIKNRIDANHNTLAVIKKYHLNGDNGLVLLSLLCCFRIHKCTMCFMLDECIGCACILLIKLYVSRLNGRLLGSLDMSVCCTTTLSSRPGYLLDVNPRVASFHVYITRIRRPARGHGVSI